MAAEEPASTTRPAKETTPIAPKSKSGGGASVPFTLQRTAPLYLALNPLVWILWLLDFIVWLLVDWIPVLLPIIRMIMFFSKGSQSYVPNSAEPSLRRNNKNKTDAANNTHKDGLMFTLDKNVAPSLPHVCPKTQYELVMASFEHFKDKPCMGTRKFLGWHKKPGEKWPVKKFGDTTWETYGEIKNKIDGFGSGLINLGMKPMPVEKSRDMVQNFSGMDGPHCLLIFEETCANWLTGAIGAMSQSLPVATSYATLGIPAVVEVINQTQAPVILCNYSNVEKLAKAAGGCQSLKTIVYTRNYVEEDAPPLKDMGDVKVLSFDEVVALGLANKVPDTPPEPDSVGLIMYTSGSTGAPKGVMLKQSNIVASSAGLVDMFKPLMTPGTQEVYLAYLPAAHILEFAAECSQLAVGSKLGFSDPKTIASSGAVRVLPDGTLNTEPTGFGNYPPGGIQEFAPTILVAVPKIWDILKKGIEKVVGGASPIVKGLLQLIFSARSAALASGRETPLLKLLLKKKFYNMLGGRVKIGITGGGPISPDIQNFCRVMFCFNLIQGYALTETCCAGTVMQADDVHDAVVGPPLQSVELRLNSCGEVKDHDEKPYLSTDKSHYGTPCNGRGEVWIRGPSVSAGYYMMREKTEAEFDADGWFHTGDIAIWTSNGTLKIVDRLKNLIKLKGGEYIAIESMESTYANSVFVDGKNGGIMCYGDGDMDKPVALVQVSVGELIKFARGEGIPSDDVDALCKDPTCIAHVTADLNKIGKPKLGANELLASVALIPGTGEPTAADVDSPWTPENMFLTASNKLNRKPIQKGFKDILAELKKKGIR